MFSIVDAKATGKVGVLSCKALWEYVSFVKDMEKFSDINNGRNILKCAKNFEETPNKSERHVHTCLTQSDDTYAVIFMGIRRNDGGPNFVFFQNESVDHPRMNIIGSTDYISCVFNMRNPGITYTRHDEKISGRGKLNVKS